MKFGTVLNVVKHFVNVMIFFFIADATVMHVVHRFGNGWSLQSVLGGVGVLGKAEYTLRFEIQRIQISSKSKLF